MDTCVNCLINPIFCSGPQNQLWRFLLAYSTVANWGAGSRWVKGVARARDFYLYPISVEMRTSVAANWPISSEKGGDSLLWLCRCFESRLLPAGGSAQCIPTGWYFHVCVGLFIRIETHNLRYQNSWVVGFFFNALYGEFQYLTIKSEWTVCVCSSSVG